MGCLKTFIITRNNRDVFFLMGVYLFVHCVGIHIEASGQLVGIAFVVPLG